MGDGILISGAGFLIGGNILITALFQKLSGGAGSKRYGMVFIFHVNGKKKIREILTIYAPVNGKIHSTLL
jgi:hypothetical protein